MFALKSNDDDKCCHDSIVYNQYVGVSLAGQLCFHDLHTELAEQYSFLVSFMCCVGEIVHLKMMF